MTGAALLGEVTDKIQHQGNVGAIAQKPPLLLHREQARVQHGLEVKREGVRGYVELARKLAGNLTFQPGLDQQTPHLEANAGCEGLEYLGGDLFVHATSPLLSS